MSALQKVAAVVFLAMLIASYQFGRHVKSGEFAEAERKADEEIAKLKDDQKEISQILSSEIARVKSEQAPKNTAITKEVVRYVEVTPPRDRCALPGTWRVRHDAAATGVPLDASAGSVAVGSAGGVEDATALETIADNYASARECSQKLVGWQQRYYKLEKALQ